MKRYLMFGICLVVGFHTTFVDSDIVKETIINIFFLSASAIFLIGVLKMFKEAFTGK